jgi:hypothetical protein
MNLPSDAEEVLKWAERDGVDLTMLRERLGLTPTDRIRRHQNALELIDALKAAKEPRRGASNRTRTDRSV